METRSIMIVGVGGQGSLLASRLLGNVLLAQGYDVKVSEVHGMSQRGGSVVTYVKYGDKVYSPVVEKGEADVVISFELLEAARCLPYLKKGRVWPHIYTLFLVVVGWAMFVGNDAGVEFGLLFRKLFIPSGGVMPLYFLRNYGVLLAVSVVCCTPLIEKLWKLLSRNAITKALTILVLLTVSMAYVVGSTNSPFLYFNF